MSVKTCDDAERNIEVSDELESLFHVLVYESCKYLQSTCQDVEGFISMYFNDSWRDRNLRFYCGQMKRAAMKMGLIYQPNGVPLIFLLPRARHLLSSPEAQATENESTVPDDPRHPIQTIIDGLMQLFKAHYVDHQREDIPRKLPDSESNDADLCTPNPQVQHVDITAQLVNEILSDVPEMRLADPEPEPEPKTDETAKLLKTHQAFGRVLANVYRFATWPENDKLPDQVHKVYKKKRSAETTKGGLREDAPPAKKRKSTVSKVA